MKRFLGILVLTTLQLSAQNPFELVDYAWFDVPRTARTVGYRINASLDTDTHMITGEQEVYLLNNSKAPIGTVQLHLYLNAFSSNHTVMAKGIQALRRMLAVPVNRHTIGYCRLLEVRANFNDVTEQVEINETVATITLPYLIQPGESVLLEMKFQTKLPRIVMRSGYADSFHMLAQWYPKLGVLKEDGSWDCPQYGPNGEFFASFGIYDVTLEIPEQFRIAATGSRVAVQPTDGRKQVRFYAEDVHDFAAAIWDRFQILQRTVAGTELYVYYPPGHEKLAERQMQALKGAFTWYNRNIGAYPYPVYSLIDVPFCGIAASGMEYPMLATGFALKVFPGWYRLPEETAIHEFSHSYFQGMLASNEHREAWLDEGITTYMTGAIMHDLYGECSFNALERFCADIFARMMDKDYSWLRYLKPDLPAHLYPSRDAYSMASYNKVALLLKTLENQMGRDQMRAIMKDYFTRYQFTHPTGQDFITAFNSHTENRYAGLLDQVIREVSFPDAAVYSVESRSLAGFRGYVPEKDAYLEEPDSRKKNQHRIILVKENLPLPVPYSIRLSNGERRKGMMAPLSTVHTETIETDPDVSIREVWVDPQRTILIDLDRSNNRYRLRPDEVAAMGSTMLYLTLLEMVSYGF